MTHREYLTWREWETENYFEPQLEHYYLMQIACEVRRVLSKKPQSIRLDDFKLQPKKRRKLDPKLATAYSKAAWVGRMTTQVVVRKKEDSGNGN